jgi:outer membrane autotransporter protein
VIQNGTGTLTLSQTNFYTGATTINAGTLALVGGIIANSSVVTVNGGATFDISNNGGFVAISTLAGSGTVQLGGNGLAIFNGSTEFSGAINGSAGLEIEAGTQTLSGVNGYTNATQIDTGATLALKGNGSIASSAFVGFAPLFAGAATLDISQTNSGTSVGVLFDIGGVGVISLGSKTLTITNGGTFNGVIADGGIAGGSGGGLTVAGNELDLGGVNTYTGPTTIAGGAILALLSPGSIAASSGVNLVGAGASFDISGSGTGQTIKDLAGVAGSTVALGSFALTVGSANSTSFAGVIADGGLSGGVGGSLIKTGTGTLTLTGANTYTGGTTINAGLINFSALANFGTGMITLNGGGLQWAAGTTTDISSRLVLGAAGAIFDTNSNNVTFASPLSGSGGITKAGNGILTLGAANTYSGGTTVTGGLINFTSAGNFGSGQVTLNGGGLQWAAGNTLDISSKLAPLGAGGGILDTNGNNITFATGLTGSGSLAKQGLGTLNLTGNNTYTGPTAVTAGTLAVNGSLTSNVTVGAAGTLGGNGTITGLVINNGIIAPGNSIGTLNINGSFVQAAGGTYQVEVNNAGQNDRINATGTATIQGGTVQVLAAAGSYANSTTYTIVRATGGVAGTYAGVTSNFAFLTPTLSYDANDVFLTLALPGQNAFTPTFLALTPNQKAVGTALNQSFANASGDFATVIGALAGLNIAQGPLALDTISGQPYADFGTMNTNNSMMFMNAIGQQMAGFHGGQPAGQRLALAQACEIEACDAVGPLSAWVSALGGLGSVLGDGNASTLTYNFGGAAAGLDYRFDPRFLAGIGVGYTHGTQWVNSFVGQGWSDSVSVAAYGSFTQGGFYLDALAGYAYFNNQLQRQILIPGLQQRTATGSTGANQFLGQAEGGYKLAIYAPAAATVTPFGRLQISSVTQNAFSESGAQSLSLNVAQQTTNSLRTTIGADLGSSIGLGNEKKLDLAVRLGWQHEFADTGRPITAAFAGAPGNSFTVFGATPARDAAVVGFQATTNIAAATQVYLRYDGGVGGGTDNHALMAGLRMSW